MSSTESGVEGSCGNAGDMELRSDFRQLQKFLHDSLGVMGERFQAMEARFAKLEQQLTEEQGRMSQLEKSVGRAVDGVMPKVEELLARHTIQLSREAALPISPAHASVAPNSTAPTNVDSTAGVPQPNLQRGLYVGGTATLPRANASASTTRTDCARVANEGQATVTPAQPSEGASPASRPSAPPPPSEASDASNPPGSLHEAAKRGDAAAVQRCLAGGARVDARDKDGNTALHVAASSGRAEVVDVLIANGSAVNRRGLRARTPLHCAAAQGHEAIVARLVTAGAEVDSRDGDGATAALLAAQRGHTVLVLWLLDHGTSVEAADKEGRTLLMYAIEGGNLQIFIRLLAKGVNVNAVDNEGETPLLTGVKKQNLQIVKDLLAKGASPIKTNKNNESPLLFGSKKGYGDMVGEMLKVATPRDKEHLKRCLDVAGSADVVWSFVDEAEDLVLGPAGGQALVGAARDGRLEVMETLLGVGVDTKTSREEALRAAAGGGRRHCVVALLDNGVDVDARDSNTNHTALYVAIMSGHLECAKELLRRGAKKEQITEEMLVRAAQEGRLGALKVLIGLGVDVDARDSKTNHTALYVATLNGHLECAKELLQRGAKKEEMLVRAAREGRLGLVKVLIRLGVHTNASREEALWAAAEGGHRGCIVALLDDGVDVNASTKSSFWTALHYAAWQGHAECVKELLQRGAKKELVDTNRQTALQIARLWNKEACVTILR